MDVCFVASEILGAHKNGGIGTATSHLALFMARHQHRVSVLYIGGSPIDYSHPWIVRCRAAGIEFTHLESRDAEVYPEWLRESSVVFDYLRHKDYGLILFQDWDGCGFASIVARRAGLAFPTTRLGVVAHGPTAWLLEANRTPARQQRTLGKLHMERVAFAEADVVICPSHHMLDWLRRNGHPLPGDSVVLPLYLWSDPEGDARFRRQAPLGTVRTLAYFGRLEERKGIELFLNALVSERLAFENFRVVFLGKAASRTPQDVIDFVRERRPWLVPRLSFETDLDSEDAQRFLVEQDCLAVIPSLIDNAPCVISECLRREIPFLSTNTGGIAELVAPQDRDLVLVEPKPQALADRIAMLLGRPLAPGRSGLGEPDVARQWLDWLDAHPKPRAIAPAGRDVPASPAVQGNRPPGLAVVLTHFERPDLVSTTLESLAAQTLTDFELVLVDDGSTSAPARQKLEEIERRRWPFRLLVLRRDNRYLGAARNAGIRATSAPRLLFMDDDNVAFPPMIETFDRAMTSLDADIITCQMTIFREATGTPDLGLLDRGERWAFTSGPAELGLSINCFGDATGIYRRDVFDRIGFFHEWRAIGHEDWHLHARAALAGLKTVIVARPALLVQTCRDRHAQHDGSIYQQQDHLGPLSRRRAAAAGTLHRPVDPQHAGRLTEPAALDVRLGRRAKPIGRESRRP